MIQVQNCRTLSTAVRHLGTLIVFARFSGAREEV
jgi:hypothetical protein